MGVSIPQVVTETKASGAQVIDGSLKFDASKTQYLTRTPGSAGNQRTWTWSGWLKRAGSSATNKHPFYGAYGGSNETSTMLAYDNSTDDAIRFEDDFINGDLAGKTPGVFRDFSGWYHVVISLDTTQSSVTDGLKIYVNGTQQTGLTNTIWNQNHNSNINSTVAQYIGSDTTAANRFFDGGMSQVYLIDGLALGPGYFGFTDPLTGTWRPKKFKAEGTTVNDGTVWSSGISGNTLSGYPATNGFDGNTSNYVYADNGTTMTWTAPKKITGQLIEVYVYAGNLHPIVKVNGQSTGAVVGGAAQQNVWVDVTDLCGGPGGSLQTIQAFGQNIGGTDRSSGFAGVRVDGVTMIDSTTQNLDFGTNGFYLPMDGNSPIGEDKSGKGNDWTSVNFGGSNSLDKATGALPILEGAGGVVANVATRTDANAANLVLALPLVGSANDVSNQINSGSTTKTITNTGVSFVNTTSNFYGGSAYFVNSEGDFLSLPYSSDFDFTTGDWTIEGWIYHTSNVSGGSHIFGTANGNVYSVNISVINHAGYPGYCLNAEFNGNSPTRIRGQNVLPLNKWVHFAVVKNSSTISLYQDGVFQNSTSSASIPSASGTVYVGRAPHDGGAYKWNGYIQDLRVYKGTARYTSNFIPASTDPDILPDTPSGVSGGSKLAKVIDGAVAFDGSGDYLDLPTSTDFGLSGSDDFTIELFTYAKAYTNSTSYSEMIRQGTSNAGSDGIYFFINSTGTVEFRMSGTTKTTSGKVNIGAWNHIAVSRSGGTVYISINGVVENFGSVTNSSTTGNFRIGANFEANSFYVGQLSNVRFIKGTALYTANFTPPTAPLTDVTNTKLLCCQSNTSAIAAAVSPTAAAVLNLPLSSTPFADSSATSATITNTGSITTTSAGTNSFNITNAASLNGSSQRITTNNTNISFQNGWTVDIYFKLDSSASGFNALINSGYGSQTSNYMYIGLDDDEKPYVETTSSGSRTTASNALSKNVWYHGRVTQDGSNITFYINGESVVTKTAQTTDLSSAGTFTIGSLLDNGNNANNFHGLIGPVRVFNSNIGAPVSGGEATSSGTLSNSASVLLNVTGDAAATNFNPFTTDINAVRGQETGYCTFNVLRERSGGYNPTFSDGNLFMDGRGDGTGTLSASSGKFYFEVLVDTVGTSGQIYLGVQDAAYPGTERGWSTAQIAAMRDTNTLYGNGSTGSGVTYGAGDLMSFAFDADNNKLYIAKNGVYLNSGNPAQGTGFTHSGISFVGGYTPIVSDGRTGQKYRLNCGQKPFKFPPPAGFQPLNAANVRPETVITRPNQYFGVTTYTGTGATRSLTTGFKPDFLWIKERGASGGPVIVDSVRGASETLQTHATTQEQADSNAVTGFNPYGFSLGSGYTVVSVNGSTRTYVGWAWKAGGNKNTFNVDGEGYASAAAAGLDGGLTVTGASVGTKQGFSIIKATGSNSQNSFKHGLGKVPKFVIAKDIDNSRAWYIYHGSLGANYRGSFDTAAFSSDSGYFGSGMTDTLVTLKSGGSGGNNYNGANMIYYVWADVPGLQKFGTYSSNNSTDGPFIELGFRPALVMVKESGAAGQSWNVFDNQRDPINPTSKYLAWNSNSQEGTLSTMDFLSNGFKIRNNDNGWNGVSSTFIYAAWAEAPEFNLYGAQSNAR